MVFNVTISERAEKNLDKVFEYLNYVKEFFDMNIKPIKTEADYKNSLKQLEEIFDATIGTPESDEADILGLLVDEYEKKHYQIPPSLKSTPPPQVFP